MNPRIRELWDEAAKLESNPSWAGRDIREHFGLEP